MNTGTRGASVSRLSPCGTFISSTMIVMMIAITPSLNPSSLFLTILARHYLCPLLLTFSFNRFRIGPGRRLRRSPPVARFPCHHVGHPPGPRYLCPREQAFQPPRFALDME